MVNDLLYERMMDGPPPGVLEQFYRSTYDHDFDGPIQRSKFNLFVGENMEHVLIEISHSRKSRVTRISAEKMETIVRGKKLTDPNLFPILLVLSNRLLKL